MDSPLFTREPEEGIRNEICINSEQHVVKRLLNIYSILIS